MSNIETAEFESGVKTLMDHSLAAIDFQAVDESDQAAMNTHVDALTDAGLALLSLRFTTEPEDFEAMTLEAYQRVYGLVEDVDSWEDSAL